MMSSITRLLARATGPAHYRTALRQHTRAVRRYREVFTPLGQVQTTLPHDVLGGDLLDLLSDQLRALLEVGDAATPAPFTDPAAHSRFVAASFAPRGNGDAFRTPPQGEQARRAPFDVGDAGPGSERSWTVPAWRHGERDTSSLSLSAPLDRVQDMPHRARSQPSGRRAQPTDAGWIPYSRAHETTAGSAFTRMIGEYWRLSANVTRERTTPFPSTLSRDGGHHRPDMTGLPGAGRGSRSWPDMPTHELAGRLHTFAAGQNVTTASTSPGQFTAPPEAGEPPERLNVIPPPLDTNSATVLHTLAENLAMVLRDQALHHGIDLT